jgi:hypothetical protein
MNATLLDIFKEFLQLSYIPSKKLIEKDVQIDDYIICRYTNSGYKFIYLYNGSCFKIPREWRDIFSSFNVYVGNRLDYLVFSEENNKVESVIYLMTELSMYLDRSMNGISGQKVLDNLGELSLISTDNFRDWCKKETNIDLGPLVFESLGSNLKI